MNYVTDKYSISTEQYINITMIMTSVIINILNYSKKEERVVGPFV